MSFGVFKFGEKCERHPQPTFRGQDNRTHAYAPIRPNPNAQKMQSSGEWFKPLPKKGDDGAPRTLAERVTVRKMMTSSGVASLISAPTPSAPSSSTTTTMSTGQPQQQQQRSSVGAALGGPEVEPPVAAGKKLAPQKSTTGLLSGAPIMSSTDFRSTGAESFSGRPVSASIPTAAGKIRPAAPSATGKVGTSTPGTGGGQTQYQDPAADTLSEAQRIQIAKNMAAGMRMPPNIPPPVNMHEVVAEIPQPKSIPPPTRSVSGAEALERSLELERNVDIHVDTIRKYILMKSNFDLPPGQSFTLQKLLKAHCTATKEMSPDDFAAALAIFNLNASAEEREALFDRFDANENGTVSFKELSDALIGVKQVATSDATARQLLADLKVKILKRNKSDDAVRAFSRAFRLMNKDKQGGLSGDELFNGLQRIGIRCKLPDIQLLVKHFDTTKDGKISQTEFLTALRGRMPLRRKKLVQEAYNILDENGDQDISLDEIAEKYDTAKHPQVLAGEKTEEEVLQQFIASWDESGDSVITWKEFLTYYKDISAGIDLDDYFELMIRNTWHISGGEGWAANTANRRVLVVHTDGSQTVEEIKNDLGIGATDLDKMRKQLEKQGINDIKEIQLAS